MCEGFVIVVSMMECLYKSSDTAQTKMSHAGLQSIAATVDRIVNVLMMEADLTPLNGEDLKEAIRTMKSVINDEQVFSVSEGEFVWILNRRFPLKRNQRNGKQHRITLKIHFDTLRYESTDSGDINETVTTTGSFGTAMQTPEELETKMRGLLALTKDDTPNKSNRSCCIS